MTRRDGRSLWPREHGAYAQLGVPLATALAVAPSLAGGACAVAAAAAFVANEPLLVVLGHRGARAREADGERAARRLATCLALAVVAGALALATAPAAARALAGAAVLPALALAALARAHRLHSLAGELVAALSLPGAGAVAAAAGGLPVAPAVATWLAWSTGYAATVVVVQRLIAGRRDARRWPDRALAAGLAAAGAAAVALGRVEAGAEIALPLLAGAAAVALARPHPRELRAIGVSLVVASLVSASVAVWLGSRMFT